MPASPVSGAADAVAKIGDLADEAGIRRVHLLSWRDLDDVEAGGSEVHAAEVARRWAAAGLEVTWRTSFAQGQPAVARRDGYRVIRKAGRYLVFPRAAAAEALGRHGAADALLEVWNGMPFLSPLWFRGPRAVMLHHVHAEMWQMVLGPENPRLATLGDVFERRVAPRFYRRTPIITPSESARQEIITLLGVRPEQVTVVPNGIGAAFSPGGRKASAPTVLAVGRLVPVKRHDLLIRAVALARRRIGGLRLVLVGDGYERPALDDLVRELDAEAWVTFVGRVGERALLRLYHRAWVVASSSAREGWGLSLSEAAACGVPTVATNIAGHADTVADGHSGLLVDGSPEALAAGLERVLGDDALRARLAAGGIEHARQFSWDATALGIMRLLAGEASKRR